MPPNTFSYSDFVVIHITILSINNLYFSVFKFWEGDYIQLYIWITLGSVGGMYAAPKIKQVGHVQGKSLTSILYLRFILYFSFVFNIYKLGQ